MGTERERNNVIADAIHDQVSSHVRDGRAIPSNLDVVAGATRIPASELPAGVRDTVSELQRQWADAKNIDVSEGSK